MIQGTTKICSHCKKEKDIQDFRRSKTGKLGYHNNCIPCHDIASKKSYIKNKEKRLKQIKEWNKENPEKVKKYKNKWAHEN